MKTQEKYYSTQETAVILGFAYSTIKKMMVQNKDPNHKSKPFPNAKKWGNTWQIPKSDVESFESNFTPYELPNKWTQEEIDTVKKYYLTDRKKLYALLPNRSEYAIIKQFSRLKLNSEII